MNGILTDEYGDMKLLGGTLAVGNTDAQVTERVLEAYPGEYKESPMLGAAARRMVGGRPDPYWPAFVKNMLARCGIKVKRIVLTSEGVNVELND